MSNQFDEFFAEVEAEAQAEGPAAVRDLRAKQMRYRLINAIITGRGYRGLSQKLLAEQSGVAQSEISRIERGRKSPTIDTYARLAAALDMEVPRPRRLRRAPAA